MIVLDSCPISAANTVEEIPRLIIREAKPCRIEWNVTPSIPALAAASSKPRLVALRHQRPAVPCCEHRILVGRVAGAEFQLHQLPGHLGG